MVDQEEVGRDRDLGIQGDDLDRDIVGLALDQEDRDRDVVRDRGRIQNIQEGIRHLFYFTFIQK